MNHARRLATLFDMLDKPLLVTKAPNLRYLTGFTGSNGFLLVGDGSATFVTDGRYGEMAQALVAGLPDTEMIVYSSGIWEVFAPLVSEMGEVALEPDGVTWEFSQSFAAETGAAVSEGGGAVENMRRTKDGDEVAALQRAAEAGDAAFEALAGIARPKLTERELGWALIDEMRRVGGEAATWEPIVAAGAGASIPHYRSGTEAIGTGLLLLDYGCVVDGYHSDMSRTVWLGESPDEEMSRVYRAVAEAQQAGIEAVAPGVSCGDVDERVRVVLRGYGYEEQFLHSTGHGVGLEIHEPPWVRRGNEDRLTPGDVITIEPGVYLPGVGGVRIEDMVLVTESGGTVMTHASREPAI